MTDSRTGLLIGLLCVGLVACQRSAPPPAANRADQLKFVRDGLVIPGTGSDLALVGESWPGMRPFTGQRFGEGLFLARHDAPGSRLYTKHEGRLRSGVVPHQPTPWRITTLPLDNVRANALTGNLPDSCVALAGTLVATGTFNGGLFVRDCTGGRPDVQRTLESDGMVKTVAFAAEPHTRPFPPDGSWQPTRLYIGAQSVRGSFRALDLPRLTEAWRVDLAEDLGEGILPAADNPWGIYSLPGVWQIVTRPEGVYFVGVHSGLHPDGTKFTRSRLYAYTPEGTRRWAWPASGPADVNILRFALGGNTMVLGMSKPFDARATGSETEFLDRTVYALDTHTGTEIGHVVLDPLPGLTEPGFIWQGVGVTGTGTTALVGLADGRALLIDIPTGHSPEKPLPVRTTFDLGTPIDSAGIPLTAPIAYALCVGDTCYVHTAGSNIPAGATATASAPPAPHPGANTLSAIDTKSGTIRWSYQAASGFNGLATDALGRWLLTTTGNPTYPDQTGGYGVLVFDTYRIGEGAQRLAWQQPLAGAPFFNLAMSNDGFFVAVTETPVRNPDGVSLTGAYQTHVYH